MPKNPDRHWTQRFHHWQQSHKWSNSGSALILDECEFRVFQCVSYKDVSRLLRMQVGTYTIHDFLRGNGFILSVFAARANPKSHPHWPANWSEWRGKHHIDKRMNIRHIWFEDIEKPWSEHMLQNPLKNSENIFGEVAEITSLQLLHVAPYAATTAIYLCILGPKNPMTLLYFVWPPVITHIVSDIHSFILAYLVSLFIIFYHYFIIAVLASSDFWPCLICGAHRRSCSQW